MNIQAAGTRRDTTFGRVVGVTSGNYATKFENG